MLPKITKEELEFIEDFHDPIAYIECMFSDVDNLSLLNDNFVHLRNHQLAQLSYEYTIDDNPNLTNKENFQLKINAGSIYDLGGRRYGKTLIDLVLDMLMSVSHLKGYPTIFSSYDHVHIRNVLEPFISSVENHPILKQFDPRVKRSPNYHIAFKNGFIIDSVNMNISSKQPGNQFFGHHVKKHWMEEASRETNKVEEKRIDAISEFGCIERFSGMSDFTKYSPAGKVFYNLKKRKYLCNYPQYINPTWDEKTRVEAIKRHGGESSVTYRIFVKGEVVTEASSVFDMERVRNTYDENRAIKHLELTKEFYKFYRETLIVERPKNIEVLYIAADIGEAAPTEIIVIGKVNEIYKYLYNITLHNLTDKEQFHIFKYLAELLKANFISLDCSIPPNEFVLCKINDKIKNIRIKDLEGNKNEIFVPTFNNQKLEWKRAVLSKHYFKGLLKKFTLNTGNLQVKVTDNHSMMVFTEKGLQEKLASECKLNDWVLSPKNYYFEGTQQFTIFKTPNVNKFVKGKEVTIPVDEDLAYLLGWAVAEGSTKYSYQFSLGDEKEYCEEILKLGRKIFGFTGGYVSKITPEYINARKPFHKKRGKRIIAKKTKYTTFFGGGKNIADFFNFQVGKGSHNKKVPEVILNSPKNIQESFLKGYFEGDGRISTNEQETTYIWGKTTSYELANQLFLLCRLTGKYPGFINLGDSYEVGFSNKPLKGRWDGVPWSVIPLKNGKGRINRKTTSLKKYRCSDEKKERFEELFNGDWCFHKIKKIEEENYNGFVYDLVVEDNHTFCAGLGNILIHNTEGTGRSIYRSLEEYFSKEHLTWVSFNEKIAVDFEKDDKGNIIFKDGKPVHREEYISEWSIHHLKDLLYMERMYLPLDYKFDSQLDSLISLQSGNRIKYETKSEEDHLLASIPYNEIVTVKINNKLKCSPIGKIKLNSNDKLYIPSYKNGNLVWEEGEIWSTFAKTNVYNFRTKVGGLEVNVTEGHGMLVFDKKIQSLIIKKAENIEINDYFLYPNNFNLTKINNYKYISINLPKSYKNSQKYNKKIIKVDEDLAYFFGFCVAEGSSTGDYGGYQLSLNTTNDPIEKLKNIYEKKIYPSSRISKLKPSCWALILNGGKNINNFFRDFCGNGAHNKKVPEIIFNSPKSVQLEFLRGLLDGDSGTTVSRELAAGMIFLMQLLNINISCDKDRGQYIIRSKLKNKILNRTGIPNELLKKPYSNSLWSKTNTFRKVNRDKILRSKYNHKILEIVKDWNFIKVKEIKKEKYEGMIYDLSVKKSNNFLAGIGNILVHNSFRVFAISEWYNCFNLIKPISTKKHFKGGI